MANVSFEKYLNPFKNNFFGAILYFSEYHHRSMSNNSKSETEQKESIL